MAKVLNVGYSEFCEQVKNKKIVLWGAGKLTSYYIQTFCAGLPIMCIIDKDEKKCNKDIYVNNVAYPVVHETYFLRQLTSNRIRSEEVAIFITPTVYVGEILVHINEIELLKDIDCYAGLLMRDKYEPEDFSFSQGKEKIPKKIHYCWFGGKDIPDHLIKYMESWKTYCPDYEIIRWDESNYDIAKNKYMKEAYEARQWAFVPDYARLDIIYNEGGIYLDTDVELLDSLDRLRNDEMFCGFQCNFVINFGCGFGAQKDHPLIKELRDYYDTLSFLLDNGQLNTRTCYEYQHPVLLNHGFHLRNRYQKKGGVVIYPSEVLAPSMGLLSESYTNHTIAIHHLEYSWSNKKEKKAFEFLKKNINSIMELSKSENSIQRV